MKRKKWTEEEEETLIGEYSDLSSSGVLAKLKTREKKFQPVADSVNSLHHLRDPVAFPFLWSWRDVSIKIQNMRHQYLGVKQKILRHPSPSSSSSSAAADFDWDHGEDHWCNFLRYRQVFGDIDLDASSRDHQKLASSSPLMLELDLDDEEDELAADGDGLEEAEEGRDLEEVGLGLCHDREVAAGARVVELGEIGVRREEKRREREAAREEEESGRRRRRREREHRWEMEASGRWRLEEEGGERWRRREERREKEEMEWRERVVGMQMEHEKQVMQMHADACQAQMHMLGILVRLVCQLIGPASSGSDGGLVGLPHQVMHNLQQQQHQSPGSLVGDNGKNDATSAGHYL